MESSVGSDLEVTHLKGVRELPLISPPPGAMDRVASLGLWVWTVTLL